MIRKQLSAAELGELLHKSRHESRQNLRRFMSDHDCKAEDIDSLLEEANKNKSAQRYADRLDREMSGESNDDLDSIARMAEMLAHVKIVMDCRGMTQTELARRCGWSQPLLSDYLRGVKAPGAENLVKMASALGCVWRLEEPK